MPNWCENNVIISHDNPEMIQKLVTAWNEGKFFGTIYPEPDYSVTPVKKTFPEIAAKYAKTEEEIALAYQPTIKPDNWWDWRVQHWGTKWEIETVYEGKPYDLEANENTISFYCSTAWSPPCGIYQKLVEQGYDVSATYYEGGMGFCGYWENDLEECYDIQNDVQWVRNNIPQNIDDQYGISDSIKEYKMDDLLTEIEAIEKELETAEEKDKARLLKEWEESKREYAELEDL